MTRPGECFTKFTVKTILLVWQTNLFRNYYVFVIRFYPIEMNVFVFFYLIEMNLFFYPIEINVFFFFIPAPAVAALVPSPPEVFASLAPAECGLPLPLFTKGYLVHPYLSLQQLEVLSSPRTKAFLAGASNTLFLHKRPLYDVLVQVSEGEGWGMSYNQQLESSCYNHHPYILLQSLSMRCNKASPNAKALEIAGSLTLYGPNSFFRHFRASPCVLESIIPTHELCFLPHRLPKFPAITLF